MLSRARGVLNNPVGVLPAPDLHLFERCYGKLLHDFFVLDDLCTDKESVTCARWAHEHAGRARCETIPSIGIPSMHVCG